MKGMPQVWPSNRSGSFQDAGVPGQPRRSLDPGLAQTPGNLGPEGVVAGPDTGPVIHRQIGDHFVTAMARPGTLWRLAPLGMPVNPGKVTEYAHQTSL
jgi:hypothetical protein